MYPFLTKPIYQPTIWAGTALDGIRGPEAEGMGSSWEITLREGSQSQIVNGAYAGRTISELIEEDPEGMLGKCDPDRLMRVGILDAGDWLSVQVHPDEAYARANENDAGKTESWYVVRAAAGSQIVAGVDLGTTDKVARAVEEGRIDEHLIRHDVSVGDFAHISSGELHALGAGVLAVEMSTNSDTTYRFYDYDRADAAGNKRELHIEKALTVLDPSAKTEVRHFSIPDNTQNRVHKLVDCDDYVLELLDVAGTMELSTGNTPNYLTFVSSAGVVSGNGNRVAVPFMRSVFVPAGVESFTISGECRVMRGRAK